MLILFIYYVFIFLGCVLFFLKIINNINVNISSIIILINIMCILNVLINILLRNGLNVFFIVVVEFIKFWYCFCLLFGVNWLVIVGIVGYINIFLKVKIIILIINIVKFLVKFVIKNDNIKMMMLINICFFKFFFNR